MSLSIRIFVCLLIGFACQEIPDPILQQFGEQSLQLPQTFEGWQRAGSAVATQGATEFATEVYLADNLLPFVYGGNGISGFALQFETDFEAQRRHSAAVRSLSGLTHVAEGESRTVSDYDGYYFFDSENPTLLFHIGNHTVILNTISTGISRTSSLRRALAFAERIFEINNLLNTRPLRPFQLAPLRFLPSNAEAILPGLTRFELDLSYIVADQPFAYVSAQIRWFKAGRGLIVFADSARVQRGTGELSFSWDVDLTDAILSDILLIRAHISYPTGDGRVIVPATSLIVPIRYNIARTNN